MSTLAKLASQAPQEDDPFARGQLARQRRVWAVQALKASLEEAHYAAAVRAVHACAFCFEGALGTMERVDRGWSDEAMVERVAAARELHNLRQAVLVRTGARWAPLVLEGLLQMQTMAEVAAEMGLRRTANGRSWPDGRRAEPRVRDVLAALSGYYEERDRGVADHAVAMVVDSLGANQG